MKEQKNIIVAVVATLVIAGGGGFFSGMKYGQTLSSGRGPNGQFSGMRNGAQTSAAAGNRLRQGTGFVNGEILSMDDKSITVKNRDGGSQIVFFAPSTSIGKTTEGAISDLTVGANVMINGKSNTDGTITATNIQIRPAGVAGFGGPGGMIPINGGTIPTTNGNVPNNK